MSSDMSMEYDPCEDCNNRICENKDTWMQCWMDLPVEAKTTNTEEEIQASMDDIICDGCGVKLHNWDPCWFCGEDNLPF